MKRPLCVTLLILTILSYPSRVSAAFLLKGGPSEISCPSDGFFAADPNQCSPTFFTCLSGVAYTSTCPANGMFDPKSMKCVASDSAVCITTTQPSTTVTSTTMTTTTSTPQTGFQCPSEEGFYPLPGVDGCAKSYYSCYDGVAYLMNCPGTSVFDSVTKRCTTESASCGVINSTTVPTTTTTSTIPSFECPAEDGFYPMPGVDGCVKEFWTCINGIAYPNSCPGSFVYDPTTKKCVNPLNCEGQSTTTMKTPSTTTKATGGTFTCPSSEGHFPDPESCSHYYQCAHGVPYKITCPGGLYYNQAILQCDWPYNVLNCNSK